MIFVCLAHFTNNYHFVSGQDASGSNLVAIGMIASPTFVTVSGLVAGFLSVTRSGSFRNLQVKLFDRGLFLLLVGHAVLALSGFATGRGFASAYRIGYITDAIGFAVVLGPWLIGALKPRSRLALAAVVFALDWCAVLLWSPGPGLPAMAKHYLVGTVNPKDWATPMGAFALIPWFCVYIAGTVIGERVGKHYFAKTERQGHLLLVKIGLGSVGVGLAVKACLVILSRVSSGFAETHPILLNVLSFYQKFPPGPMYFLFFGGAGMLLVAAVLESGRLRLQPFLLNQLRQIGLASLFVYVLQFYLYVVALKSLHLPYTPYWPLLFLFSLVLLAFAANAWNSIEGNRFLTVGIGPLVDWNTRKRAARRSGLANSANSPVIGPQLQA
jgi:hypothetical protein